MAKASSVITDSSYRQGSLRCEDRKGIIVHIYTDVDCDDVPLETKSMYVINEPGSTFTAEEVCERVGKKLNFSSLTLYMFGLATIDNPPLWLAPQHEILCDEDIAQHYWFRLRFLPPKQKVMYLARSGSHKEAFNYFFLQCRHDFVHEKIQYNLKGGKLGMDLALGLGVTDMVRYGKEYGYDLNFIITKLKPKLFIPTGTKNLFRNFMDKKRLKLNFKPQIEREFQDCKDDSDTDIKLRYIYNGLLQNASQYGMESYDVEGDETLCIDIHSPQNHHVYSIKKTSSVLEKENVVRIEDLNNISISTDGKQVHIDKKEKSTDCDSA